MNTQKGLLSILLSVVIIGGGAYLYLQNNEKTTQEKVFENEIEDEFAKEEKENRENKDVAYTDKSAIDTITPKVAMENVVTTAYIISLDGNKITLDYFDVLTGEDAERAAIEDGVCTLEQINNGCFPNGPIYDRNINPKLRVFEVAQDFKMFGLFPLDPEKSTELPVYTLEDLEDFSFNKGSDENPYYFPYTVVIEDNIVVSATGLYRP